jgi:hypothetical protein
VWENWNPEDDVVPGEEDDEGEAASSSGGGERLPVMVTEVVNGNEFFVQVCTHIAAATGWYACCCNMVVDAELLGWLCKRGAIGA